MTYGTLQGTWHYQEHKTNDGGESYITGFKDGGGCILYKL